MVASLADLIAAKGYAVADGAMGTQLFAVGLCAGDPPEGWNLTHAPEVQAIHRAYIRAGAELLITNSFGGNRFRLALHNHQARVGEFNRAAARNAKIAAEIETEAAAEREVNGDSGGGKSGGGGGERARREGDGCESAGRVGAAGESAGREKVGGKSAGDTSAGGKNAGGEGARTVLVAGSMGPSGELLEPLGNVSAAACQAAFAEQAEALAAGGADLLWIETMSALAELEAAVRGARSACDLPVAATMSFDTAGRTMMGVSATELAERLGALSLAAMGANCGNNVADTEAAVVAIASSGTATPVISKPNAGVPCWSGDALVYDGTPEVLAAHAHRVRGAGVAVIGSCCGSTPAHTAKIAAVLRGDEPPPNIEAAPRAAPGTPDRMARRRSRRG